MGITLPHAECLACQFSNELKANVPKVIRVILSCQNQDQLDVAYSMAERFCHGLLLKYVDRETTSSKMLYNPAIEVLRITFFSLCRELQSEIGEINEDS